MITAVQPAGFPDPSSTDQAAKPAPIADVAKQAPPEPTPEANVRLTIDASPDGPFFVYTLQDRETGRIIVQLPRHRAEALGDQPSYHPGDLIRAKALSPTRAAPLAPDVVNG